MSFIFWSWTSIMSIRDTFVWGLLLTLVSPCGLCLVCRSYYGLCTIGKLVHIVMRRKCSYSHPILYVMVNIFWDHQDFSCTHREWDHQPPPPLLLSLSSLLPPNSIKHILMALAKNYKWQNSSSLNERN